MLRLRSLAAACASIFLTDASFPQIPYDYLDVCSPVHRFRGTPLEAEFGDRVENIGDVDHDGIDDILVSILRNHIGGRYSGAVRVYSLGTGAELYTVRGDQPSQRFRAMGGGGDVDGDGTPDWVAAGALGAVHAHSGADGSRLWSAALPYVVASAAIVGDVNGDGHADIVAGVPWWYQPPAPYGGAAHVLSGLDGSVIRAHTGERAGFRMGAGVVGIGDRDGDGVADYAVGANRGGPDHEGEVYIYSGATGQVAYSLTVSTPVPGEFGQYLDLADDLDGDGVRDLIVLDTHYSFPYMGVLYAYSLATGSLIYTVEASPEARFKRACANVGDADGDGIGDLALFVGHLQGGNRSEAVDVLSGVDGTLIRRFAGPRNYEGTGDVTGVGDVDGDGVPEFVAANPLRRGVLVISTGTQTSEQFCEGELNSTGQRGHLRFSGSRRVSLNDTYVSVRDMAGGMLTQVFYGSRRVHKPFGSGVVCIGGRLHRLGSPFQSSSGGSGGFALDLTDPTYTSPPGALVAGSTWGFQAWYRDTPDAGGFNFTNALSLTFCP